MTYHKTYQAYAHGRFTNTVENKVISTSENINDLRLVCLPYLNEVSYISIERILQSGKRRIVGYLFNWRGEPFYHTYWMSESARQMENTKQKSRFYGVPVFVVNKYTGDLSQKEIVRSAQTYFEMVMSLENDINN